MTLPTKMNIPSENIADYTLFIAGDKKVGKTSLASQFPDHYIMEFEPGNASHLCCRHTDIHSWKEACDLIEEIKANPTYCKTLIIDDVPSLYRYCYQHARKLLRLGKIDKDNFDVWRTTRLEMTDLFQTILKLPVGKIFTAHTVITPVEDRHGNTYSQLAAALSNQCREIIMGPMTLSGVMQFTEGGKRTLIIEGDNFVQAGHGFANNFTWKGQRLKEIPLGRSPQQGYENFMAAFNNKLEVKEKK